MSDRKGALIKILSVPIYPHELADPTEALADYLIDNDVFPVTRCKDCKYGVWNEEEQLWQCVYSAELDEGIGEYFGFFEYNEGEHFCSRGERKDNE